LPSPWNWSWQVLLINNSPWFQQDFHISALHTSNNNSPKAVFFKCYWTWLMSVLY
jgi:hypothetical protein